MKKGSEVSHYAGFPNYDHPDAIRFDDLIHDLRALRANIPVNVMTKSERINPEYKTKGRKEHVLTPKPLIILEGFLALYDPQIRHLLDYSIYLHVDFQLSSQRRTKQTGDGYVEKVLYPMQIQYVKPTRQYADIIFDAGIVSSQELCDILLSLFKKQRLV
jgi:uridine kinase